MKGKYVISLFLITMLAVLVSAGEIGLIENETWQSNLLGSNSKNGAVLGDINGDGYLDLISVGCTVSLTSCTRSDADKTRVWTNNGTSFIENTTWEQNLTNSSTSLALGDIDNDGDLDLVISGIGEGAGGTKIYINNGTAFNENSTWQSVLMNPLFLDESASVALGDIDNDGDLDLLLSDSTNAVYINNGTSFENSSIWGQEVTRNVGRVSTGLADFDNDGDLDLNIAGVSSSKTYLNNGTTFIHNSSFGAGGGDEASVAWGDIDNDGDFDQVVGGFLAFTRLFLNEINTSGFFIDSSSEWGIGGTFSFGFAMFGDYDNNGYLDLVLSGLSGGTPRFFIQNNNGSTFEQDVTAQANLTISSAGSKLWGDIDNDGDLDLVVIGSQKVYISNASLTNPNEIPTPPTSFSSSYNNREIALGWLNGSDNETPVNGLYYNLKLGTVSNNHSIISGIYGGAGHATRGGSAYGYYGNMMQRKNFTLNVDRLKPSTTYYWSVQTIDTGLKKGNWSNVQSFTTSADLNRPNVTLNSPVDNANFSSYSITFNASVADENVTNVSLWGDWTGSFIINETNLSGIDDSDYIFTKDLTTYGDGTYTWQIQATDNETNVQNSSIISFTIDTTPPSFTNLENQTVVVNISFSYNINATDSGVGLGNFSVNDTTNFSINATSGVITNGTILSIGYYTVNVSVNDTLGNLNWSLWSVNVTPDTINPNITINSPTAGQNLTSSNVTINISFSDNLVLEYCSYNITNSVGGAVVNDTNITCGLSSVKYQTISDGSNYLLTTFANDTSGNINVTNRTFSIDTSVPSSPPSSSGGGGGSSTPSFWSNTYVVSDEDFEKGYVKELSKKQRVKISVGGETHHVGVVEISKTTATINITSDPIQIILNIGQDVKLDVLNDNFYDIYVLLNDIVNEKANLTIKSIHEEIPEGKGIIDTTGEIVDGEDVVGEEVEEKKKASKSLIFGIILIVIIALFYFRKYLWNKELKKRRKVLRRLNL